MPVKGFNLANNPAYPLNPRNHGLFPQINVLSPQKTIKHLSSPGYFNLYSNYLWWKCERKSTASLFAFQSEVWWRGKRVGMDNDVDLIYNLTYLRSTWITIQDFIKIYPMVLECLSEHALFFYYCKIRQKMVFKSKLYRSQIIFLINHDP